MKDMYRFLALFLFLGFIGCGVSKNVVSNPNLIGRDPTWFPWQIDSYHAALLTAFTSELIEEIGNEENIDISLVDINPIQVLTSLDDGSVGGILTTLTPNLIKQAKYSFSDPVILLGPVLVVSLESQASSLTDLKEKIVAVCEHDDSELIVQKYPAIVIQTYQQVPIALQDVAEGRIEGALIPFLQAHSLIPQQYKSQLKIISKPLNDKGVRLMTLKDQNTELIHKFNIGLQKIKSSNAYQKLGCGLQKGWDH
jgi:ABC-type amino acid transport substrate-binding protein